MPCIAGAALKVREPQADTYSPEAATAPRVFIPIHFVEHSMRIRVSALALAIGAALSSSAVSSAWAVDFSYNGFSTAAYSQSDTDEAKVGYLSQPNGIDSDGTFAIDSKLGMQVSAKFNDMVSATVQGVAYADLTGDWEPHLDWAYVRVQALPNLSARAGYLRAPTFLFSDSIFIGYANSWVRAPLEVYNQSPSYQLRGVDLTWRQNVGPVALSLQPYFGDTELDIGEAEETYKLKNWVGLVAMAEINGFTFRAGYSEIEMDTNPPALAPLIAGLRSVPSAFCAGCSVAADGLEFKGATYKVLALGSQYDDGTNLAIAEYVKRTDTAELISPDTHGAYVTYGRRFGSVMPYATYAIARVDSPTSTNLIPAVGPLAPLAAGVNAAMSGNSDQDSYSVGVRYEVPSFLMVKGALVKLQYDHIDTDGGPGMLNDVQPGFDGTVDMISASFDFIF